MDLAFHLAWKSSVFSQSSSTPSRPFCGATRSHHSVSSAHQQQQHPPPLVSSSSSSLSLSLSLSLSPSLRATKTPLIPSPRRLIVRIRPHPSNGIHKVGFPCFSPREW